MSNFKSIGIGKFFQDLEYYQFNTSHCYLKIGVNSFIEFPEGKKVDARKKYSQKDLTGDWCFRFREVKATVSLDRRW